MSATTLTISKHRNGDKERNLEEIQDSITSKNDVLALIKCLSGQANLLTVPRLYLDLLQGDWPAATSCRNWFTGKINLPEQTDTSIRVIKTGTTNCH